MAPSLTERISNALPKDVELILHHCSALPTSTSPLFVPAPGSKPEATELESHFLSASIHSDDGLVQVFAIEILAYTTATLTTLFVSKADSTGFLHLLKLPTGNGSIIRTILIEFLIHLIESKKQADSRLVLSLFARAQDQYLFPGSIENQGKHVLDDRGLIKWWARIIDQIFAYYKPSASLQGQRENETNAHHVRGHVVVPGIDAHEARTFIPRDAEYKPSAFWQVSDPLQSLGMPEEVPERCLIPRFPDDPKARFAIDLDDELPEPPKEEISEVQPGKEPPSEQEKAETQPQPVLGPNDGRWRSVRSLAQFWELMSFRQECSAGRLVGFLWGIWEPVSLVGKPFQATVSSEDRLEGNTRITEGLPPSLAVQSAERSGLPTPASSQQPPRDDATAVPVSSLLNDETAPTPTQAPNLVSLNSSQHPTSQVQASTQGTPPEVHVSVPPPVDAVQPLQIPPLVKPTMAEVILTPDAYARLMELLLTLDYCDLPAAVGSSRRLLDAIGKEGGKLCWGVEAVGSKAAEQTKEKMGPSEVNSLAGLIRKRPKNEANTLSAGLVRKKPKT